MISFIVHGTPRSQQAKRAKQRWKNCVQSAAPPQTGLLHGPLRLRIDFFFDGDTDLDTDNIIKPIQDALEKIIYVNDSSIVDVCSRKVNLAQLPPLIGAPASLLRGLAADDDKDFVLIRVSHAYPKVTFQ